MDNITQKYEVLLKKWKDLFESLRTRRLHNETVAGFGDVRARQLLDEYWDILQLILNDIVKEMKKKKYDVDTEQEVPKEIWDSFKPKIEPILEMYKKDIRDFLKAYSSDIASLKPDILEEIKIMSDVTMIDVLNSFNKVLKEGY